MDGPALLNLARDLAIAARQPETTLLLTIDQAEERSVIAPRRRRAAVETADRRLMAIATLRSDFLGEFQSHPVLQDSEYPHHFRYRAVPVDPMPLRNFPVIIQGPARLAGVQLDDGLVETIVHGTGTQGGLCRGPLRCLTLLELVLLRVGEVELPGLASHLFDRDQIPHGSPQCLDLFLGREGQARRIRDGITVRPLLEYEVDLARHLRWLATPVGRDAHAQAHNASLRPRRL